MTETKVERRRYTDDEKRQAMEIHASVNGRQDLVAKLLEEAELTMTVATVRDWATRRHRDLYADIHQGVKAYARIKASDRYKAITDRAQDVMDMALRQESEALARGDVPVKDLAKMAQQAAITAAIGSDKSQLLDGEPTHIVGGSVNDTYDGLRKLATMGVRITMPGPDGKPMLMPLDVKAKPQPAALPEQSD